MAFFRGQDGSVSIGTNVIGQVNQFSVSTTQEELETTSMGDAWKGYVGGLGSWSGSCQVKLDYGDAQQKALIDNLMAASPLGTTVTLRFRISATKYLSGSAIVKDIQFSSALGQIVGATFSFTGSGALTPTWS